MLTAWQSGHACEEEDTKPGRMLKTDCFTPRQTSSVSELFTSGPDKGSITLSKEKFRKDRLQRPPAPSSEGLAGGGCLMTTSRVGRMRLSCFGSAVGNRTQGEAWGEKDVLLCGLLFWALFISNNSQAGKQSREAT